MGRRSLAFLILGLSAGCAEAWQPDLPPDLPAVAGAEVLAEGLSRPDSLVAAGGGFVLLERDEGRVLAMNDRGEE
ncbi:MAG: hypothetical protein VX498_02665, partial [Myxococcota bacterium]|nr:hypothetical protein [Myxococcota bacterium]